LNIEIYTLNIDDEIEQERVKRLEPILKQPISKEDQTKENKSCDCNFCNEFRKYNTSIKKSVTETLNEVLMNIAKNNL
jgi:hypothetical protein